MVATLNQFFFGRDTDPSHTVYHLTQAVRLVNQTLNTSEALSNANLGVVNFMAVHEMLNGAKEGARIHLKGLEKMVQLRGGILSLGSDTVLMLKVCK